MSGVDNNEIRCKHCNRLLAKGEAVYIELKCPRCGAYTILCAASANRAGRRASCVEEPWPQNADHTIRQS